MIDKLFQAQHVIPISYQIWYQPISVWGLLKILFPQFLISPRTRRMYISSSQKRKLKYFMVSKQPKKSKTEIIDNIKLKQELTDRKLDASSWQWICIMYMQMCRWASARCVSKTKDSLVLVQSLVLAFRKPSNLVYKNTKSTSIFNSVQTVCCSICKTTQSAVHRNCSQMPSGKN